MENELKRILVLGYNWDMSTKIFVGNFGSVLDSASFSITLVTVEMIHAINLDLWDIFIFSRTFDQKSYMMLHQAIQKGKSVIYMLDDDLLGVYENKEFQAFSPGTIVYDTIQKQITAADLVITFSPVTTEVVRLLNSRVITMKTHILSKYITEFVSKSDEEPFRVVYAGTPTKREEFGSLWPALQKLSEEKKEQVEFHFWGMDVNGFGPLKSPVHMQSYVFNYESYIQRLKSAHFHILIAPLFDRIRAQKAKCPIKYLEATAGGCIGIYSDVFPYHDIKHLETGIKTLNSIDGWLRSFNMVCNLSNEERRVIWTTAKEHILREYTTESQVDSFVMALHEAQAATSLRLKMLS